MKIKKIDGALLKKMFEYGAKNLEIFKWIGVSSTNR